MSTDPQRTRPLFWCKSGASTLTLSYAPLARYLNFNFALVDENGELTQGREPYRDRTDGAGGARDSGASAERRDGLLGDGRAVVGGVAAAAGRRDEGADDGGHAAQLGDGAHARAGQAEAAGGHLRDRRDRRGEERMVPGPMGGVSPELGGVADLGRGGLAGGDVWEQRRVLKNTEALRAWSG